MFENESNQIWNFYVKSNQVESFLFENKSNLFRVSNLKTNRIHYDLSSNLNY